MCKSQWDKEQYFYDTDDLYLEISLCLNFAITAQKNFNNVIGAFIFCACTQSHVLFKIMTVSTVMILNIVSLMITNFRRRNA